MEAVHVAFLVGILQGSEDAPQNARVGMSIKLACRSSRYYFILRNKLLITTDLSEEEMRPIRFLVGNLEVSDSIRTICSAKAADKAVSDSFRLAVSAALISFIFLG